MFPLSVSPPEILSFSLPPMAIGFAQMPPEILNFILSHGVALCVYTTGNIKLQSFLTAIYPVYAIETAN